ncbi:MAG: ROK family protein [Dehalococcoidia bacterium]
MPEDRQRPVLTVDIGGTKMIVAVVLPAGKIISRRYYLTQADGGTRAVINRLSSAINRSIAQGRFKKTELMGIGIAVAGILDTRRGMVSTSPNLPGWRNVPLRDIIAARSGLATYLINDASAAALGEQRFGAGRGFDNLLYLTVSTGIGGGIIINGELYSGADGCAGELGHMTIEANGPQCHCGNFGCLEALASGWAIAKEAVTRINQGERSSIAELVDGGVDNITAETVATAARRGDKVACDIVAKAANYLGIGLANLVNIFNPELIVIGGGLSKMGNMLLKPAREVIKERAFRLPAQSVRIVRARLGSNAGIIGAAIHVGFQRVKAGAQT